MGGSLNSDKLPLTEILKFQLNQVNTLTGRKPTLKGFEINNGLFDVITALEGDKLPPIESKEAAPLMGFFKHMIPGFRLAYKQKQIDITKDPGFVKTPQQTAVRDSGFVKTPIIKKPIPQDRGFFKMPQLIASKKQEGGLMIPNLGIGPITR